MRRGARLGAALSAGLLLLSGLSINALTAGIEIPQRPAIGPPTHTYDENSDAASPRRGPIPRAAFERVRGIPARGPAAFGGDRVYDIDVSGTSYRVHEFTTVGSAGRFTITRPIDVEVLIVAGGGGGGGSIGGGGGAGEFIERVGAANRVALTPSGSPYTITVGAGGVGGSYSGPTDGSDGGDSSAFGISAAGGGGGGAIYRTGRPGGSGGGAGSVLTVAAGGTAQVSGSGFGFAGGSGSCGSCGSAAAVAGGGGGAGGVGAASSGQSGGAGGPGRSTSITGIARSFAGGGGGGINSDPAARSSGPSGAGQAGGGAGGDYGTRATDRGVTEDYGQDAVPNSGSGGGGAGNPIGETGRAGGNGGSGIVIVRYEIPRSTWTPMSLAGAGLPTPVDVAVDGLAYREYRFETPGTVTAEFEVTHLADPIEMLLVGAGGGGGRDAGGGGGGGALLEGRLAVTTPGVRSLSVTVGAGGERGLWSAPSTRATAGGSSAVSLTTGGSPEFSAVAAGGRAGPANFSSTTDTNGGVSTGAGGVAPTAPTVTGATWQSVTARGGGQGGSPPGTGYSTRGPGGVAPAGGGTSELFPGPSYGGGGGGGSSENGYQAPGTNGGGSGSGTDASACRTDLRATAGGANTGGGGGAGAAYGPTATCRDASGLNTRDGEPGGNGIVIIRYPLHREIADLPSEVREVVAGEGASTAVLRWRVPAISAPSVDLDGYRIEYAATNSSTWTALTASEVTLAISGAGDSMLVTATITGVPTSARHRFRITPVGSIDGPSTIVESVAKGGDTVTLVGDDVVHRYTTVGSSTFTLGADRPVDALLVGGGGGGAGGDWAGGGGAGGVLEGGEVALAAGTIPVVVGAGGNGGASSGTAAARTGGDGGASSLGTVVAPGGGGGGTAGWNDPSHTGQGRSGGSGGGTGEHGSSAERDGVLLYETSNPTRQSNGIVYRSGFGTASGNAWQTFTNAGTPITSVTYRMQVDVGGVSRFAEVTFDPWAGLTARDLRVPDLLAANQFVVQRFVSNMRVESNMDAAVSARSTGVVTGTGRTGYLEIWPWNYGTAAAAAGPTGSNVSTFDFNDTHTGGSVYGSFQVHDVTTRGAERTVLAWNRHSEAAPDIGLGSQLTDNPDWTFASTNSLGKSGWRLDIRVNKNPWQSLAGGSSTLTAPAGWTAHGHAGGANRVMASQAGSGGGGAGGPGGDVPDSSRLPLNGVTRPRVAGNGGPGISSSITGSPVVYAGGGGGGTQDDGSDLCSAGGSGGGGAGRCLGAVGSVAVAGTAGLGGGGGGGHVSAGAAGGSGTVVLRYAFLDSGVEGGVFASTATSAVLRWEDPAEGAGSVTGYRIERLGPPSSEWGGATVVAPTANIRVHTLELTGLTSNPQRRFRVTALHGERDGSTTELTAIGRGGDTVTLVGDDIVHRFTTIGTSDFVLGAARTVEHLIVGGGGGGGGGRGGGGGGGGGLVTGSAVRAAASWNVRVGSGGAGGSYGVSGTTGQASSVFALTAAGGGGGGSLDSSQGRAGGSGGGRRVNSDGAGGAATQPGSSTGGFGNAGGGSSSTSTSGTLYYSGGGGGGAGQAGFSGTPTLGADRGRGGAGRTSLITGIATTYAGGGGGGRGHQDSDGPAPGGSGGGGSGGDRDNGLSGTNARGGGGGGAGYGWSNEEYVGGRGGSGVVILRYPFFP